jgi:cell division protein FtsW (lipid II flippase)
MNATRSITPTRDAPGPWRRRLALALQCLPLLAAGSCATRGALGEATHEAWFTDIRYLVVASALAWGIGYLPLRQWGRWAIAFTLGLIGSLLAANASLQGWGTAPSGQNEAALQQAALIWAGAIVVAVALLLLDTRRLLPRGDGRHRPGTPRTEGPTTIVRPG